MITHCYRLGPNGAITYVATPTLRALQVWLNQHHDQAATLLAQPVGKCCHIYLRLVSVFAPHPQVEAMAAIVTDLVQPFASHDGTKKESY